MSWPQTIAVSATTKPTTCVEVSTSPAPSVAATPPGSRCAATKSSGKKAPMLSTPSTVLRHHHAPCGSRRPSASAMIPAGRHRRSAAKSGCPSGSRCVVTM
ncbi:hypothetical protein BJY28_002465 [Janibacter alkaliphilus]|uniref:Uncharacterized protein n=1 Tax=Janibacter alkaliphilus TaxID=1069963 RepID=A0A852X4M8_9MICO|nr:hypothetical protein [Janibacter alkaliphilus]